MDNTQRNYKPLVIIFLVVTIIAVLLAIFPPRKISTPARVNLVPELPTCKGFYIERYDNTPVDGDRGGLCFGRVKQSPNPHYLGDGTAAPDLIACTADAKMCPDGSYVGRTGPNCEFATCPMMEPDTVYRNKEAGFQIDLLGASFNEEDAIVRSDGLQSFRVRRGPSLSPAYLRIVGMSPEPCSQGDPVTVKGIEYLMAEELGLFGGMESGSVDATYCTEHNGKSYFLLFTWQYPRHEVAGPDRDTATEAFNAELEKLDFQFIN